MSREAMKEEGKKAGRQGKRSIQGLNTALPSKRNIQNKAVS